MHACLLACSANSQCRPFSDIQFFESTAAKQSLKDGNWLFVASKEGFKSFRRAVADHINMAVAT